jgi:hypothetical protein
MTAHECFYRGCKELVVGKYHCERHEAILQQQRETRSRRNSERRASETRRVQIGEKRYVDRGSGWRMQIAGTKGPNFVRLNRGEAEYVEERARAVLPQVLPR